MTLEVRRVIDPRMTDGDARGLVLSILERSGGDGWTTDRLAGRLGLPLGTVTGIIAELARTGLVERVDDEWVSTLGVDH
jgi:DNA-binding IclR family transcriptional regulator